MKRKKINLPLILCAVFVAVLSCFACFRVADTNIVKADLVTTNYEYQSSVIYVPVRRNNDSNTNRYVDNLIWSITLSNRGNSLTFDFDDSAILMAVNTNSYQGYNYNYVFYNDLRFGRNGTAVVSFDVTNNVTGSSAIYFNGTSNYFSLYYEIQQGFIADIASVEFGNDGSTGDYWNWLKYTDVNGKSMKLSFYIKDILSSSDLLNYRIYYLSPDLTDNQVYNQGYQEGIQNNQPNIYNDGYNAGRVAGYNSGYSAGLESTNTYTFKNLIGAALDVPLNTFTSLFNFEILGVNLKDFLFAMFTICVVITIINLTRR